MSLNLRKSVETDLNFVLASETAEENRAFVSVWTKEQHAAALKDKDVVHLIIEKDKNRVGYIILAGLKNENQSVEFQRIVVTEKGKSIGREALRRVKQMAFEDLNAHRLWLDVKDFNERARKLYESEGFVTEGFCATASRKMINGSHWF